MLLPAKLHDTAGCREIDRLAIAGGIPGYELMCRAGASARCAAGLRWPAPRRAAVFCGTGNNGGDGFVVARLLRRDGVDVTVGLQGAREKISGDALLALRAWEAVGGAIFPAAQVGLSGCELVVDALLGTGLQRAPGGALADLIVRLNASRLPTLALDVPTGLDSDTGHTPGVCVRADLTVTFIGLKRGLLTGAAPEFTGTLAFDDLGVAPQVSGRVAPCAERIDPAPPFAWGGPPSAHKGRFGHVLVIGGGPGMRGAPQLAGLAALRAGAGLVSIATHPEHTGAGGPLETMLHGVADPAGLAPLLERSSVLAVGPGLGRSAWAAGLLAAALDSGRPVVIDADALNLLAARHRRVPNAILTPHPGEAGRLLGTTIAEVQANRFAALARILERFSPAATILKGNGTLIGAGERVALIDRGTPALASGGTGDVLTGVVAALWARCDDPCQAAVAGAWLHAAAGEGAARGRTRGLLAGDLLEWIGRCQPA